MTTYKKESIVISEEDVSELECPVCFSIPKVNAIHQCGNGHITCFECYRKLHNKKCPQCRAEMVITRFPGIVSKYIYLSIFELIRVKGAGRHILDLGALECHLCCSIPKTRQIYQCEEGHVACIDCFSANCCLYFQYQTTCAKCRRQNTYLFKTRFPKFISNILSRFG